MAPSASRPGSRCGWATRRCSSARSRRAGCWRPPGCRPARSTARCSTRCSRSGGRHGRRCAHAAGAARRRPAGRLCRVAVGGRAAAPVHVGDYVDFYSSLEHATNLGRMFRPGAEPLLPNWRHLPVGYHGRASSVVPTGTPVRRPAGNSRPPRPAARQASGPRSGSISSSSSGSSPAPATRSGPPIPASEAAEHVFGFVLVNDWSARDIQRWEYQPLGPVPRQVVRHLDLAVGRAVRGARAVPRPRPAPGARAARVPARARRLGARHRARGRARGHRRVARERPWPVLDVPAAARPRDDQRHQRPPRRPLRLRHDLRRRAGDRRAA